MSLLKVMPYFMTQEFSPTDIAGLQLWLKADAGLYQDTAKTTPATLDGDVVGAWEDQSGNGNDATQSTTSKKPLLKTGIVNEKPVVRFDGVDDNFSLSMTLTNFTLFVVANKPAHGGIWFGKSGVNTDIGYTGRVRFDGGVIYSDMMPSPLSSIELMDFVRDGTTSLTSWRNGSQYRQYTSITSNTLPIGNIFSQGGYYYVAGDAVEIILYNTAISTANRQSVDNYLNGRYSLW